MNILYLCDEYPPGRHGGIGTAVQLLAREMVRQGHKVVVAGFYDWGYGEQDRFTDEGVEVYRFRRRWASEKLIKQDSLPVVAVYKLGKLTGVLQRDIQNSLQRYREFLEELIAQYNIQLVEMPDYNDYMRFCKSYIPFPKLSVPVIVKMHGSLTFIYKGNNYQLPQHIWQMEHDILEQATAVCAVSRYAGNTTAGYLKYDKPVAVMYNGIDILQLQPQSHKATNRVIYTGALTENKGICQLLQAWNMVHEQIPDAELELYGKGPVKKLKKLLASSSLKKVHFMGHVSKAALFEKLGKAVVAVFPSYAETFGLAAIEAMGSKVATIFTNRTSGPEVIDNNNDGLLVDPADIRSIADAIIYLLKNDVERNGIADKGYEKVINNFDIKEVARQHIVYYETVIGGVNSVSL